MPDATPSKIFARLHSDYSILSPTHDMAERYAAGANAPLWCYRLTFQSPVMDGRLGATHTLETPLILRTIDRSPLLEPTYPAQQLSRRMSAAWASFAATGNPGVAAHDPHWPAYGGTRQSLIFDASCRLAPLISNELSALWQAVRVAGSQ